MIDPAKAVKGLPVTVRQKAMVVNGIEFPRPRPFPGVIQSLDVPAKNRGQGCWVVDKRRGGTLFCVWEELSPRRAKEGEE